MKKQKGSITRKNASSATAADRRASIRQAMERQRKKQEIKSKAGGMNLKRKENHLAAIADQRQSSHELLDNVCGYLNRIGNAMDNDSSLDNHPRREELIGAMDQLAKDGKAYSDTLDQIEEEVKRFEESPERDPVLMTRDSFGICETFQSKRDEMAHRMMSATLLAQEIIYDDAGDAGKTAE